MLPPNGPLVLELEPKPNGDEVPVVEDGPNEKGLVFGVSGSLELPFRSIPVDRTGLSSINTSVSPFGGVAALGTFAVEVVPNEKGLLDTSAPLLPLAGVANNTDPPAGAGDDVPPKLNGVFSGAGVVGVDGLEENENGDLEAAGASVVDGVAAGPNENAELGGDGANNDFGASTAGVVELAVAGGVPKENADLGASTGLATGGPKLNGD